MFTPACPPDAELSSRCLRAAAGQLRLRIGSTLSLPFGQ
jgi:hypothetical protein